MLWSDDTVRAISHDRIRQRMYDGETERLAKRIRATEQRKRRIRPPWLWSRVRPPAENQVQFAGLRHPHHSW